jgi:hypothetical protein
MAIMDTNTTITPQNVVDRYADFVTTTANADLAWWSGNLPFPEFDNSYFQEGSNAGGKPISVDVNTVGIAGNLIDASDIYDALLVETATYTMLRNLNAQLFVGGGGGNTGSRGSPGTVFNETRKAYFNSSYLQPIDTVDIGDVLSNNIITASELENLFDRFRTEYNNKKENTINVVVSVCHASCHSSCHGSRGRR